MLSFLGLLPTAIIIMFLVVSCFLKGDTYTFRRYRRYAFVYGYYFQTIRSQITAVLIQRLQVLLVFITSSKYGQLLHQFLLYRLSTPILAMLSFMLVLHYYQHSLEFLQILALAIMHLCILNRFQQSLALVPKGSAGDLHRMYYIALLLIYVNCLILATFFFPSIYSFFIWLNSFHG